MSAPVDSRAAVAARWCGAWEDVAARPIVAGQPGAVGGSLTADCVIAAYRCGYFPFPAGDAQRVATNRERHEASVAAGNVVVLPTEQGREPFEIVWWCPAERPVLPVGELSVPRSLARRVRNKVSWNTTCNEAFAAVVEGCRRDRADRWITDPMLDTLQELHLGGWVHSIEVWDGPELVGGTFGMALGDVFTLDSTFHLQSGAGRIALADLQQRLAGTSCRLMDYQWRGAFVDSLGPDYIPVENYRAALGTTREPWAPETGRRAAERLVPVGGAA